MKKTISFLILGTVIIFSSCQIKSNQVPKISFQGEAQGTYYVVTYFDEQNRDLQDQIDSILKDFDQSLSSWVPNSIISRVNRNENNVVLDKYFEDNFYLSQRVAQESGGAFDCTVDPLVEAWGFGFRQRIDLTKEMVDSIKQFVGYEKVKIEDNHLIKADPRMELSFNAVAQGYSVDLVGKFLLDNGISDFVIDIGGEVLAKGNKPDSGLWQVGIQKPTDDQNGAIEAEVVVALKDKALVTSGSYRKYYEKNGIRYSHEIDPATGYPVTHSLLSVSVLADKCADADAYATAFMVMGLDKSLDFLKKRSDLEAYFIYMDSTRKMVTKSTPGLLNLIQE